MSVSKGRVVTWGGGSGVGRRDCRVGVCGLGGGGCR